MSKSSVYKELLEWWRPDDYDDERWAELSEATVRSTDFFVPSRLSEGEARIVRQKFNAACSYSSGDVLILGTILLSAMILGYWSIIINTIQPFIQKIIACYKDPFAVSGYGVPAKIKRVLLRAIRNRRAAREKKSGRNAVYRHALMLKLTQYSMKEKQHAMGERNFTKMQDDIAKVFLNDCLKEHASIRLYNLDAKALRVYWLQTRNDYRKSILLLTWALIMLIFVEEVDETRSTVIAIEFFLVVPQVLHVALLVYSESPMHFSHSKLHMFALVIVVFLACDSSLNFAALFFSVIQPTKRWSRPLRSFLLVLHSRSAKDEMTKLLRCLPSVVTITTLTVFMLTIFSLVMIALMDGRATEDDMFETFLRGMDTLYVFAFSGENYSAVLASTAGDTRWMVIVILLIYMALGIVMLSYLTATMFTTYLQEHTKLILHYRITQKMALFAAFAALVRQNANELTMHDWNKVTEKIRPDDKGGKGKESNFLFQILDDDNSKKLSLMEFLDLVEVSQVRISARNEKDTWLVGMAQFNGLARVLWLRQHVKAVVESDVFDLVIMGCIVMNMLITGILGATKKVALPLLDSVQFIRTLISVVYVFEVFMKIFAWGWKKYWAFGWNKFDLTLVLVSVTAWIPTETYVRQLGPGALTFVTVVKLVVILRICRLFVFIDTWREFLEVFMRIVTGILRVALALFILLYSTMSIATLMFYNKYIPEQHEPDFQSHWEATILTMQCLMGDNWHWVKHRAVTTSEFPLSYIQGGLFYFINVILSIIVLNLIVASFLEYMMKEHDTVERLTKRTQAILKMEQSYRRDRHLEMVKEETNRMDEHFVEKNFSMLEEEAKKWPDLARGLDPSEQVLEPCEAGHVSCDKTCKECLHSMLKWVSVNTRPRQLGFDAAVAKPAQPAADADDTTANGLQLECQTGPLNTARKFPLVIDDEKLPEDIGTWLAPRNYRIDARNYPPTPSEQATEFDEVGAYFDVNLVCEFQQSLKAEHAKLYSKNPHEVQPKEMWFRVIKLVQEYSVKHFLTGVNFTQALKIMTDVYKELDKAEEIAKALAPHDPKKLMKQAADLAKKARSTTDDGEEDPSLDEIKAWARRQDWAHTSALPPGAIREYAQRLARLTRQPELSSVYVPLRSTSFEPPDRNAVNGHDGNGRDGTAAPTLTNETTTVAKAVRIAAEGSTVITAEREAAAGISDIMTNGHHSSAPPTTLAAALPAGTEVDTLSSLGSTVLRPQPHIMSEGDETRPQRMADSQPAVAQHIRSFRESARASVPRQAQA